MFVSWRARTDSRRGTYERLRTRTIGHVGGVGKGEADSTGKGRSAETRYENGPDLTAGKLGNSQLENQRQQGRPRTD